MWCSSLGDCCKWLTGTLDVSCRPFTNISLSRDEPRTISGILQIRNLAASNAVFGFWKCMLTLISRSVNLRLYMKKPPITMTTITSSTDRVPRIPFILPFTSESFVSGLFRNDGAVPSSFDWEYVNEKEENN